MFLHFIGTSDGWLLNLNNVLGVEDTSDAAGPSVKIHTPAAEVELTFEGDDAERILQRVELIAQASDFQVMQLIGGQPPATEVPA